MARSKAENQREHARHRASERFGLNLHQDAQSSIVRTIQAGKARFIRRQSGRVTIWEVEYEGRRLPIVYDTKRKTIATVLPETALTEPERILENERSNQAQNDLTDQPL